ncbi:MAG: hypothetical protein ACTHN5_13065 [Phycisphaerae bacterium]
MNMVYRLLVASTILVVTSSGAFRGVAFAADAPPAQPSGAAAEVALQRALDQPFNLVLEKVEIREAFNRIAATAKISLSVDPACYDFLPYGATTRVSADFRSAKLRDAIEQVLITLGLQQTVSGSTVIIRPSAPLMHIGRRAQLGELKLLQDLRSDQNELMPPAAAPGATTQPEPLDWTTAIRTALDRRNIVVSLEGDANSPLHDKAMEEITKQLPMTIFRGLETYCQITNQIWFAESDPYSAGGATIHIMPMKQWIMRQLDRPIQVNFVNTPSDEVLAELSHLTGIRFVPQPGLYAAFPALNLKSGNGSVRQTLEALAGGAGIAYEVRDDSILLKVASGANTAQPATTQTNAQSDNIVAYLAVPTGPTGRLMNVVIRESDLPPELNDLRKEKIKEAVQLLEHAWLPKAPASTTQPATRPAATEPATQPGK